MHTQAQPAAANLPDCADRGLDAAAEYEDSAATAHRKWLHQAEETGNSPDDPNALWLDLGAYT